MAANTRSASHLMTCSPASRHTEISHLRHIERFTILKGRKPSILHFSFLLLDTSLSLSQLDLPFWIRPVLGCGGDILAYKAYLEWVDMRIDIAWGYLCCCIYDGVVAVVDILIYVYSYSLLCLTT